MKALLSKGDGSDETVDLGDWGSRRLTRDELLWVDLESPGEDDLEAVRRAVDLSDDAVEALESDPGKPDARVLENAVEVIVLSGGRRGQRCHAPPHPDGQRMGDHQA